MNNFKYHIQNWITHLLKMKDQAVWNVKKNNKKIKIKTYTYYTYNKKEGLLNEQTEISYSKLNNTCLLRMEHTTVWYVNNLILLL